MPGGYADAVRALRARQEVASEKDRLMQRADRRTDLKRFGPDDYKDRARAILITAAMSVPGMCPYATMLCLWFYVYHKSFLQAFVVSGSFFVLGMLFFAGSTKRALGKDRPWLWWFGAVWIQATVVGLIVGFFLYFRYLAYFWKYEETRTYNNVTAAEDASAFGDGSIFVFTEEVRLDTMRSVGFKSRWTGETFCVAPLVDATMSQANEIQYWAVGQDCCAARAEFFCGDAGDFTTHSALRILEPEDVVRPFMRWAVRGANYPKYLEAVRLQEATYSTKSSPTPTLIMWSKDPVAAKDAFFDDARDICIRVSLAYFAVVLVALYFVAWRLIPKQRHEGVIRM